MPQLLATLSASVTLIAIIAMTYATIGWLSWKSFVVGALNANEITISQSVAMISLVWVLTAATRGDNGNAKARGRVEPRMQRLPVLASAGRVARTVPLPVSCVLVSVRGMGRER